MRLGLGLKVRIGTGLECDGVGVGPHDKHWARCASPRCSWRKDLSAVPVKMLMMKLEKSSMGRLELVKKMMFMSIMQRKKLLMLAKRRKAQEKSNKSGEGRISCR